MKSVKSRSRKNAFINGIVVVSLLLFSVLSVILIWYRGTLYFTRGDSFFHLGRALELMKSNRWLPSYAMNSFNDLGSAVMTMYPYLLLYPLAFLLKWLTLKHSLLVFYITYTFLAALISYFSSLSFSRNRQISYLFAVIYAFSGEFLAASFYSHVTDIGVYFSAIFIPLVIFGLIYWLLNGRWLMMSIGMSLIVFSNLISVAFLVVLLLLFIVMNYRRVTWQKLLNLVKAAGLTVLTASVVWLPILRLSLHNQLWIPVIRPVGLISLRSTLRNALRNNFIQGCQSLTLFSLLGVIVGGLLIFKLPKLVRRLYGFAILVIWLSSDLFPWRWLFKSTTLLRMMTHLQTTFRVLVVPQMILEFVLAFTVIKGLTKPFRHLIETILLIILAVTQLQVQRSYLETGADLVAHRRGVTNSRQILRSSLRVHKPDYWPQRSLSARRDLFHNNGSDGRQKVHFVLSGHGDLNFKLLKRANRLRVPFLRYSGVRYRCALDGRLITPKISPNHTMTVCHVGPGIHQLRITPVNSRFFDLARNLSLTSVPIYGLAAYVYIKRRMKTKNR